MSTARPMVNHNGDSLLVKNILSGGAQFYRETDSFTKGLSDDNDEIKEEHESRTDEDDFDNEDEDECDDGEEEEDDPDGDGGAGGGVDDDDRLPQCKIKRNYSCVKCDYYTQNPRFYLYHQKEKHGEKMKIYECAHCLYASKHSQKLQRHIHMVHVMGGGKRRNKGGDGAWPAVGSNKKPKASPQAPAPLPPPPQPSVPHTDIYQIEESAGEIEEPMYAPDGTLVFRCSVCDMTAKTQGLIARHERIVHLKKKFFRCSKCNYVTHMKARYTKHVKYHSMPMIKCDMCDFKTPYKWNLDRHNKNHTGDGPFKCSICNFTAEIKQSLTVHEMNHHVPPVGHFIPPSRRRLKVGASDTMGMVTEEDQIEQSELELLRMEREGAYEQNPADFVQAQLDIPSESTTITTAVAATTSQSTQETAPTTSSAPSSSPPSDHTPPIVTAVEKKKLPRPIPNLIPIKSLHSLNGPQEDSSTLHDFASIVTTAEEVSRCSSQQSLPPHQNPNKKPSDSFKKKNASFFDKLKEKLMTSTSEGNLTCSFCGFEAKCLSEHMKHQKSHVCLNDADGSEGSRSPNNEISPPSTTETSSSTRCRHCRQRCKSSSDLVQHLTCCPALVRDEEEEEEEEEDQEREEEGMVTAEAPVKKEKLEDETNNNQVHPMENRVFVWNNVDEIKDESQQYVSPLPPPPLYPLEDRRRDSVDEKVYVGIEVKPGYGTTTAKGPSNDITPRDVNTKKVFKCPHCSFWASTASRFHVHIVGHLNKRPFQCSLCHYSSNWRWDITKHIRLKSIRDPGHEKAKVLLTDEAGRRNYSKYNQYLTTMKMENQQATSKPPRRILPKEVNQVNIGVKRLQEESEEDNEATSVKKKPHLENKKTMWKCKKCYFRDNDREVVLEHVRDHYRNSTGRKKKPSDDSSVAPAALLPSQPLLAKVETRQSTPSASDDDDDDEQEDDENQNQRNDDPEELCPDFMCETCPYVCDSWTELEAHMEKHFVCTVSGKHFKCQHCSYFAQDKKELSEHIDYHGDNPDGRTFACYDCPYMAVSRPQLVYHSKRHNRDDLFEQHRCHKCSYSARNNTALALHVRLHGRNNQTDCQSSKAQPDVSGVDTNKHPDIPLVWVSKPMGISKMYKCRYCPQINGRKSAIMAHEKGHRDQPGNHHQPLATDSGEVIRCPDCNWTCTGPTPLSAHLKFHQGLFGQVVGVVETGRSDEEQMTELKEKVYQRREKIVWNNQDNAASEEKEKAGLEKKDNENRTIHFCSICPARFLFSNQMDIHTRFHEMKLPFRCNSCSYTARQKQHLMAHLKVHTDEYQERTSVLTELYQIAAGYPRPKIAIVLGGKDSNESVWIVVANDSDASMGEIPCETVSVDQQGLKEEEAAYANNNNNSKSGKRFACCKCPAEFIKNDPLVYHLTLHGGPGPHRCKYCDYAVKTYGNLIRHEFVHKTAAGSRHKRPPPEHVPTSGTELFKQKNEANAAAAAAATTTTPSSSITAAAPVVKPLSPPPAQLFMDPEFGILIHGSPEFIYPTYLKNGKMKEKRYKCHKCPSAFEKREQYKIHLSLHGSKQRYNCEKCDYSVKYYANFTQHMKKHDECDANRKKLAVGATVSDVNSTDAPLEATTESSTAAHRQQVEQQRRSAKTMKMSTAEQQTMMILQQRRIATGGLATNGGGSEHRDAPMINRCPQCPYSNSRKDGVVSHVRCHADKGAAFTCKYCDYNVPQLHFLRDHLKTHFTPSKYVKPDAYMKIERMEIWAEPIEPTEQRQPSPSSADSKFLVFKDQGDVWKDAERRFFPRLRVSEPTDPFSILSSDKGRVYINLKTGEEAVEVDDEETKVTETNSPQFDVRQMDVDDGEKEADGEEILPEKRQRLELSEKDTTDISNTDSESEQYDSEETH